MRFAARPSVEAEGLLERGGQVTVGQPGHRYRRFAPGRGNGRSKSRGTNATGTTRTRPAAGQISIGRRVESGFSRRSTSSGRSGQNASLSGLSRLEDGERAQQASAANQRQFAVRFGTTNPTRQN